MTVGVQWAMAAGAVLAAVAALLAFRFERPAPAAAPT